MEQLFEIYTESKTADDVEEIEKEVDKIMNTDNYGFDQLARYAVKVSNGKNILVELDVPETKEEPTIFMTAYEYEGNLEDFNCDNEIGCIDFNGDWHSLRAEMAHFAEDLMEV